MAVSSSQSYRAGQLAVMDAWGLVTKLLLLTTRVCLGLQAMKQGTARMACGGGAGEVFCLSGHLVIELYSYLFQICFTKAVTSKRHKVL